MEVCESDWEEHRVACGLHEMLVRRCKDVPGALPALCYCSGGFFVVMIRRPPRSTLFPYRTRVRSRRVIRRSRELGFGVDAIRKLIALSEPGLQACAQIRDLASEHVAGIDARIADLQRLRGVLQQAVDACEAGRRIHCPVIEIGRAHV